MIKSALNIIFGMVLGIFFSIAGFFYWSSYKMIKIHTLEYPLVLSSDEESKNFHLLPKGTTLYFDKAFPEGFTRYKVYINIDRLPLKLQELADPTEIIPIEAFSPDKEILRKLLQDYPLTKNDLIAILKSGKISKEEIHDLLNEYSK